MSETFVFVISIAYLVSLATVTFVIARATRKQLGEEEAEREQEQQRDR